MFSKLLKKYNGFSKIELLVGIAVLAILLLLAVPQFLGYTRQAETTRLLNNGKIVESAVARYQITNEQWPKAGVAAITPSIMTLDGTMIHQDNPEIAGKTFYAVDGTRIDRDISRIDTTRFVVDGSGIVYILNPNHIRVTGVRLNPSSLLLRIGEIADVNASVEPRNASISGIVWETSDATIASVDNNGIITAHAVGQAAISAHSLNYLSYSGTVNVTVIPAPVAVITMTPSTNINTTTSVTFMHNTESNGVAITGAEWQINNEAIIATMPSRTFDMGSHTIRLRVQDANGTWSAWESTVFDVVSLPVATITMTPSTNINTTTSVTFTHNTESNGVAIASAEWQRNNDAITTTPPSGRFPAGAHTVRLRVQNSAGVWSEWVTRTFSVGAIAVVAADFEHSFTIRSDGTLWAWGNNGSGQLGNGGTTHSPLPARVGTLTNIVSVGAGQAHTLALNRYGDLWAWGNNSHGQLGDGTTITTWQKFSPLHIMTNVASVAAGGTHSLAIMHDGTVWAWGDNSLGQLGDGTTTNRATPVEVRGLKNIASVVARARHSLALTRDGDLWSWGHNGFGWRGDGITTGNTLPVRILTNVTSVAAGEGHSLAIMRDGTVRAWGNNSRGQLGDGTTVNRDIPVEIRGLANVVSVAGGQGHSFAVKQNGTLWGWGDNRFGQVCGNNFLQNILVPTRVGISTNVVSVAGGQGHSLAVKQNGTLWAWGRNNRGQLGIGSFADPWGQVQVAPAIFP